MKVSNTSLEVGKTGSAGYSGAIIKLSKGTNGPLGDVYIGNYMSGFRVSSRPGLSPPYLIATSDTVYVPKQLCLGDSTKPENCRTSWPGTTTGLQLKCQTVHDTLKPTRPRTTATNSVYASCPDGTTLTGGGYEGGGGDYISSAPSGNAWWCHRESPIPGNDGTLGHCYAVCCKIA